MNKLELLAAKVEADTLDNLKRTGLDCEANRLNAKTSIKPGKKYTKVDVGSSGKYMVDAEGNIFGIKAYGVIHTGHQYGTLDTINEWYWGQYRAVKVR